MSQAGIDDRLDRGFAQPGVGFPPIDTDLRGFLETYPTGDDYHWAFEHSHDTVLNLIKYFGVKRVCEIGAGRRPLYSQDTVESLGLEYTCNDIIQSELDRAPAWTQKACFDIAAPRLPDGEADKYDLVFSMMVMEHVRDARQTYRNIFQILRPGGIFFNFHPVLYSPPFIVNRLMPEQLGRRVLRMVQPYRTDDNIPKFPARYSYCVLNQRLDNMLAETGFSERHVVPFYHHGYFLKLPLLREADRALSDFARRRDVRTLASFSYTMGRKAAAAAA